MREDKFVGEVEILQFGGPTLEEELIDNADLQSNYLFLSEQQLSSIDVQRVA
jgi:hypothetical protein